MWDLRSKDAVRTFTENEDFIGDMILHKGKLVCGSGDGTLAVYDIRKGTLYAMSDNMEDELLSLALLKVSFFSFLLIIKQERHEISVRLTRRSFEHIQLGRLGRCV